MPEMRELGLSAGPVQALPPTSTDERSPPLHDNDNASTRVDETSANGSIRRTSSITEPPPDGGYGWVVVFACFVHTFWINAWTGSWGILQAALFRSTLRDSSSSTLSFIGSLGLCVAPMFGIVAIQVARCIGAKWNSLLGVLSIGVGLIVSGSAVHSVVGMFFACGFSYGVGSCLIYAMCNSLPVQWFSKKLGTANGIVKLGGGIGATVMGIVTGLITERVGVAWTFRIFGLATLATGIPASFVVKERVSARKDYSIDWSVFKDVPFVSLFLCGAVGVFAIYIPSFFLPYVGEALGLSNATTTGVVACFNACMAIGRIASGMACDKFGSMNILFLTMLLNAVTFFAIWSVSSSLAVLLVFSILNGVANGAFFVALPTAIGKYLGTSKATGGITLALTAWGPGLLVGNPIAGFLIDVTGADEADSIVPFRPAIFYAGGTALISTGFVVLAYAYMKKGLSRVV